MRIIGLDIHRAFAEAVAWDNGKLNRLGRVDMRRHLLEAFAKKLIKEDVVVVEATGNAASVAAMIAPHQAENAHPKSRAEDLRRDFRRPQKRPRSTPAKRMRQLSPKRRLCLH
jgi:hypothetical protein